MKVIDDIGEEAILNAVLATIQPPSADRLRVTELIDSPRIKQLRLKYWDKIVVPVSKMIYRLRGSVVHDIIAKNATANSLTEEKMKLQVAHAGGLVTISGTPDKYTAEGELIDFKYTSMYAFMTIKPEWEAQLNVYRRMFEKHGFPVRKLTIKAILDDWNASEASRKPDYPQVPFKNIDIPIWSDDETTDFLIERVALHKAAEKELPFCTDAEVWRKPTTWAVMKKGQVKAKAVFGTEKRPGDEDAAVQYVKDNFPAKDHKLYDVITRPGRYTRCEAYCDVAPFCTQWLAIKNSMQDTEE